MGRGMHGMMMSSVPMMEGRLAYMKADLGITDAQASAWEAYATAVRAQQTAMQSMHDDMMKTMGSGSALDRMDIRIKAMETMVDSLKALKPATTALYAVLTDAQKEKANQLLGGACGMM
jgi:LTXXQ motif family protein